MDNVWHNDRTQGEVKKTSSYAGQELVGEDDPERLVVVGCARNDPRAFISRLVGDARTDHLPRHEGAATRVARIWRVHVAMLRSLQTTDARQC